MNTARSCVEGSDEPDEFASRSLYQSVHSWTLDLGAQSSRCRTHRRFDDVDGPVPRLRSKVAVAGASDTHDVFQVASGILTEGLG